MRCRVRGRERKYSRPTGSRTSVDRLSRAVLPRLGQPCSPQFYILARCNKAPLPLPVAVSAPVSADLALLSLLLYPRSRLCNLIHQQFHCSPFVPLWIIYRFSSILKLFERGDNGIRSSNAAYQNYLFNPA